VDDPLDGADAMIALTMAIKAAAALALATANSPPPPAEEVLALVVTNNRSTRLERPDLRYADDDGARYHRMFRGLARASGLLLLTRFDRATAEAHPELVALARPPRRRELAEALATLAARVAEARRHGRRTHFYFVYAGHGDVELGKGYLDLEDGRLDAEFLERQVVEAVGADVQHLVLDACNSFFVVNPRKPGGRRWATPRDLALGFARRHPNVGLFLSTNTEAEVYEWSELESGIFSHEVRSGLSGAADVDSDGRVSYRELAAFVETANRDLPRANVRPQIFFRGPAGDDGATLFAPQQAAGRRLALGTGARRLWIRGRGGERLVDLHKEDAPVTLVVPGDGAEPLSVVEWLPPPAADTPPSLREYEVTAGAGDVSLARLTAAPADSTSRGGARLFAGLWQAPFGPRAFARWQDKRASAPEPVYGVSAADEVRMRHYLTFIAETDRQATAGLTASLLGSGGLLTGTAVAAAFAEPRWEGARSQALLLGGGGLLLMGAGLHFALRPSHGEQALASFEAELAASPENRALAVARTEAHLDAIAARELLGLRVFASLIGAAGAAAAVGTTVRLARGDVHGRQTATLASGYGTAALLGLFSYRLFTLESPTARLLRLYREDPGLKLRFEVAPMPGSMGLGLAGRF
jgi:hypothetical protein